MRVSRTPVLAALLALLSFACSWSAEPIRDPSRKGFGGETCIRCHTSEKPPAPGLVEETFDTVIVGGGMAGLAALHYLPDRKAVLLEAEDQAGGQMRMESWRGKRFSQGAAYLVGAYGILQDFYNSEKLPVVRIPEPENSAWIGGKYYPACWTHEGRGKMPWTGQAMKNWLAFLEEMEKVNNMNESNQPFEAFTWEQQQLDDISTYDWLKKKGLTEEMIEHFDRYIPSCFGVESKDLSAAAFANYISGEIGGNYTMEGGMGAVTNHIYKNHKRNIRLGCRVTHVFQTRDDVRVTYLGPDGRGHTIRGRTAILAVPQNLVPEMMPDLPQEKKDVIAGTRYAAYTVANVLCKEVLWDDKGYDTWTQGTFFRDIIDADWINRKGKPHTNKKQPHVLTLYIPMGVDGMKAQMEWNPSVWKEKVLTDLETIIPGCREKIEDVRFYRWGHSMHVCEPGFLKKAVPVLRKPYYRVFFAGAEVEGLPCNESAIFSGYFAARGVRTWLWDTVPGARGLLKGALDMRLKMGLD
ncbi:MAG: FAD-dependent oxidoreductase [Candidatus Wallbacteria bacterium]|nr:FAD-dependent oxidoreductase [Candidatus Wallbacteria bacterium]